MNTFASRRRQPVSSRGPVVVASRSALTPDPCSALGPARAPFAPIVQAKLRIDAANDRCEQEADRIADQVMRMPALTVQRACACGGRAADEECAECESERLRLQRTANGSAPMACAPGSVHAALRTPGSPLDEATRQFMEARLGCDLSHVRIHTDTLANDSAKSVGALAYTCGSNIVFAAAHYRPASARRQQITGP